MNKQFLEYVDINNNKKKVLLKEYKFNDICNVYEGHNITYCTTSDIKECCKRNNLDYDKFCEWLTGQTLPIIPEEKDPYDCVYSWDTERWIVSMLSKNKEPVVYD